MVELRNLALLATALISLACNERLLDTNEVAVEPYCMYAAGTMGTRPDGTSFVLIDPVLDATPYVCSCITEEQFGDEAQLAPIEDELNDRLFDKCESVSDALGYISNECRDHHDTNYWIPQVLFAVGEYELDFQCSGEGWIDLDKDPDPPICMLGEPGCSCTVEAKCSGGTTCIDGMCQSPP